MTQPALTYSRQPHELLASIYTHCMLARWDYVRAGRTVVKPYMACIAAARLDVESLLDATPSDPRPKRRKARRLPNG